MADSENQASANLKNHAGSSAHKDIFDFFGLPPELRNIIYSYLTEDVTTKCKDDSLSDETRITVEGKALVTALLLSRRFRHEYEAEIRGRQTVVLTDLGASQQYKKLSALSKRSSKAKIQLLVVCSGASERCGCNKDIEASLEWIEGQLEELRFLTAVKIETRPCMGQSISTEWMEHIPGATTPFESIVKAPTGLDIEIYPFCVLDLDDLHKAYEDRRPPLRKGSRSEGWQDCA